MAFPCTIAPGRPSLCLPARSQKRTPSSRIAALRINGASSRPSRPDVVSCNRRHQRLAIQAAAEPENGGSSSTEAEESLTENDSMAKDKPLPGSGVNLFDPAATASRFLTRRFGIVGGLGFVALLASTELYEIGKALLERDSEGTGEVVETPSGLSYRDIKVGGGVKPKAGDFVGAQFVVKVGDEVLLDTKKTGHPIAFTYGKRPYLSVNCAGVEEGLSTMKRGGVRELTVPAELAYGGEKRELPGGVVVRPGSTVTFVVTLEEVTGSYL